MLFSSFIGALIPSRPYDVDCFPSPVDRETLKEEQ
jgi:hypothetical protein